MHCKCLVCEKDIHIIHPGDDQKALLPIIVGGNVFIYFGYGSTFDTMGDMRHEEIQFQAYICDDCFKRKEYLTRKIKIHNQKTWEII